jgi:hypothetical protein
MRRTRRRGGEVNNNSYVPQPSFGFKRTGMSAVKNVKKYTCEELRDLVEQSGDIKKFNGKQQEMLKQMICFPQMDKAAENARQHAIELPEESSFKNFIEKVRAAYAKPRR